MLEALPRQETANFNKPSIMEPKDKTVDLSLYTYYLEDWQLDELVNHLDVPDISEPDDEYSWDDFLLDNADDYDDFLLKN